MGAQAAPAEHDAAQLAGLVLEGKVGVSGRGAGQVGDLTPHPQVAEHSVAVEQSLQVGDHVAYAQHQAVHHSSSNSACPYSTGWPSSTRTRRTTPPTSASTSLISFMASISPITWPGSTMLPSRTNGSPCGSAER